MSVNLGKGPEDWEIFQQGPTVIERTKLIADDNREYHRLKGTNSMNEGPLYDHSRYIHELGTQMLKVQKSSSVKTSSTANSDITKLPKVRRIPRKKISVAEVEKSGKLIAMDLEWDTTSWSQEEIEGGCETLISLFQRPEANDAYEDQALKMLEKLMHRHAVAVTFMRKNIETLLSKTVSRRLHSTGQSGGILRLLKVINICTSRFAKELSTFNTVGRMLEMLLIEARLASIIIQHAFRVHSHKTRPEDMGAFDVGFGTRRDVELQMKHAVNARSSELKQKWRAMHISQTNSQRRSKYGIRGPVHVDEKYVKLMLKIMIFLVSDSAGQYATVNREDAVRSGGLILLSNLVYSINGPFCFDTAKILTCISNIPDSLLPMLHTGCVKAILNYFKLLRRKGDKSHIKEMQEAIVVIIRLGNHAAGLFRAAGNYKYIRQPLSEAEELIDYKAFLMKLDRQKLTNDVRSMLSSKDVVIELVQTIISCSYVPIVSVAVTCLFTLSCSECYSRVLDEILALGSRGLCRIVQLLEEVDVTVAMPSLCLLLQLCTREDCRGGMTTSKLPLMLGAIVRDSSRYDEPNYQRAMLALTALCRRGEWRAYDPLELPSLFSNKNALINATYIDLMTMVKKPEPGENHDLGAMLVMPTDNESAKYLSTVAEKVGSSALCDFLCKPSDQRHFHALPWTAAASGCSIIEALVLQPEAATRVISQATARYLGQCVYFTFLEISEHSFGEVRTKEMLCAIMSSLNALHNLCFAARDIPEESHKVKAGVMESHVIQASVFFAMTLSTIHPSLGQYPTLKKMQQKVGLKAVYFLDSYAQLLLDSRDMAELCGLGGEVGYPMSEVLGSLLTVYGITSEMWNILDRLCRLLSKLILPPSSVHASLRGWKLPQALRVHQAPPLGNLALALSTGFAEDNKILATPASYFEVLANIAVVEPGRMLVFADGFLRRALEKLSLSMRNIETEEQLELWVVAARTRGADTPPPSIARLEVTACLRVINNCANFSSPKYGATNDLILRPDYDVIGVAVSILSSTACPRSDAAVTAALNTLFVFSKDVVLVSEKFERLDVIGVVKNEFNRYEELSEEYSRVCVEIILNMSTGLRGTSSARRLTNMREEVFRVSRLFPSLSKLVQNALWMMTKDSLQNSVEADPLPGSMEELLKYAAAEEAAEEKNRKLEEARKLKDEAAAAAAEEEGKEEHHHGRPGTYDYCGTTSCGSLRIPLTAESHGSYASSPSKPSTDSHPLHYLRMPMTEGGCDVSKESAREKGLKDELHRRKYLFGFADKETPHAENDRSTPTAKTATSLPDLITSKSFTSMNTNKNNEMTIFMNSNDNNNRINSKKNKSKLRGKKLDIIINNSEYSNCRPPVVSIDVSEMPELKMTRPPPRKI